MGEAIDSNVRVIELLERAQCGSAGEAPFDVAAPGNRVLCECRFAEQVLCPRCDFELHAADAADAPCRRAVLRGPGASYLLPVTLERNAFLADGSNEWARDASVPATAVSGTGMIVCALQTCAYCPCGSMRTTPIRWRAGWRNVSVMWGETNVAIGEVTMMRCRTCMATFELPLPAGAMDAAGPLAGAMLRHRE